MLKIETKTIKREMVVGKEITAQRIITRRTNIKRICAGDWFGVGTFNNFSETKFKKR
jgi:hypothetical protein